MSISATLHGNGRSGAVNALNARSLLKAEQAPKVVRIKKTTDEQQIVFGEVYAPGFPDSQVDFMSAETIRDMAYGFMKKSATTKIDVGHSRDECGAFVVESFIARDDDPVFIPGSWVIGVKVPDDVWALVKSGDLNGFSLDGMGTRVPTMFENEMPELLKGETSEVGGHQHEFLVKFDEDGSFLGGRTSAASDGHYHTILRGTATEVANGHSHRFSFVEGVLDAQAVN